MGIRRLACLIVLALLALAPSAHAASWAQPQIRYVVDHGLMAPSVAEFRPTAVLTRRELAEVIAALTRAEQVVENPDAPVTLRELDAGLVKALGLYRSAGSVRKAFAAADLAPPPNFGTEVVARLLRLRYNHPAASDSRELLPGDPVNRAEAAYSVWRVLQLSAYDVTRAANLASGLRLPSLTDWQRRVLARAVRYVGWPYIWGGTSPGPQVTFGVPSRGGFDCSGLVWRVYKLERYVNAPTLGSTIHGRTTYEMSGEFPRARRIRLAGLRPADLVFTGDRGTKSAPSQIGHVALYLGGRWFVHSSSQGTTIAPLEGWYLDRFAWGRRPLAEAGLQ
jgi:NlpC/P60 family protein